MALNFLATAGQLMPSFLQGYRAAREDNWDDLNQYNKVQAGQIQNAWSEAIFEPNLNMVWDNAAVSAMNRDTSGLNYQVRQAAHPGLMQAQITRSYAMPWIAAAQNAALLQQTMNPAMWGGGYSMMPQGGGMGFGGMMPGYMQQLAAQGYDMDDWAEMLRGY